MKKFQIIMFLVVSVHSFSQNLTVSDTVTLQNFQHRFTYKSLIVPVVLIGYGAFGVRNNQIKSFDFQIRDEVLENIDKKITVDDFSQYAPATSVLVFSAMGLKGKHSLRDQSVLTATSLLVMSTSVYALKKITKVERPDGSSNNSFPSGHTATAFAGAELLRMEYGSESIWYGIAGYAVATGTGVFRIYNNRHWLTDVVAGAGVGILSTKIAYWVNPYLTKIIFGDHDRVTTTTLISPFYDGNHFGIAMSRTF